MVTKTIREVVFFVLIFLLAFIAIRSAGYWTEHSKANNNVIAIVAGILFTLVIVALYYVFRIGRHNSRQGFEVPMAARCQGDPYMWQGDSWYAKQCQALASSREGRAMLASYTCPSGYHGQPRRPFRYTPISDGKWQNRRCDDFTDAKGGELDDLCSMKKKFYSYGS